MKIPHDSIKIPLTGVDGLRPSVVINGEFEPLSVMRNTNFRYQKPLPIPVTPASSRIIPALNRCTEFLLRGDRRTPSDIKSSRGFMPRINNFKGNIDSHDVLKHVGYETAGRTMFISFTRSLSVAKSFGAGGWLYVARVHDGVDTSTDGYSSSQAEVAAYAHVFWQDIYAFREETSQAEFLYINPEFNGENISNATLAQARSMILGTLQEPFDRSLYDSESESESDV